MEKSKQVFLILLLVFVFTQAKGQAPNFSLSVKNIVNMFNWPQDSIMEFDIYMQWINPGSSDSFKYCSGQYYLNYNTGIVSGGTLTLSKVGSDLPPAYQNPTFLVASGRLQVAPNLPVTPGVLINESFPGTKIIRLRLRTSTIAWNPVALNLVWRAASPSPYTKVSYLNSSGLLVDITSVPGNIFTGDSTFISPVELASFISSITRNNVTLNWSTTKETINRGFDIERKVFNGSDWIRAGNVAGNGTTNDTKHYTFTDRVSAGKYSYRLKQTDFNGNTQYFNLSNEVEVGVPAAYYVSQNYPNPFNPSTKIDYDLPYAGKVSILLYDMSGREVGNLINEVKDAGYYTVKFNGSSLASGMYFYRITAQGNNQNFVSTKKMALIK